MASKKKSKRKDNAEFAENAESAEKEKGLTQRAQRKSALRLRSGQVEVTEKIGKTRTLKTAGCGTQRGKAA